MNKTVGQVLTEARALKEISLQDAARATHIRVQYLQELENDRPDLLPSKTQARGFLRLYADFLGLDADPLLKQWESSPLVEIETREPIKVSGAKNRSREKELKKSEKFKWGEFIAKMRTFLMDYLQSKKKTTSQNGDVQKATASLDRVDKVEEISGKAKNEEHPKKKPLSIDFFRRKSPKKEPIESSKGTSKEIPRRTATEIFHEVGEQIRQRREKLGLSLSDVEQFTRVRRIYLQAIEEGNFEALPSSVQARGMVTNYAHFLEMDEDAVVGLFTEGLEVQRHEKLQEKWASPVPPIQISIHIPEKIRRIITPDLLFGSLVVIGLFVFIFWGAAQVFSKNNEITPTSEFSISEKLQSTPTFLTTFQETVTSTLEETEMLTNTTGAAGITVLSPTPAPPMATANAAPLQLYIIAQQRAWMRVSVDGKVEFEGRIVPGNAYTFSGEKHIQLVSGNGAALEAYFNQQYLGVLGDFGEVITLDFSSEGVSKFTPTIAATPLLTVTSTIAPSVVPTLLPTVTVEE